MARVRYNNTLGLLGAALGGSIGDTTITFASAPAFSTLAAGDYIPLVLEPPLSSTPSINFEIVHLTSYVAGATTGTVARGQEGTSRIAHANNSLWECGPLVQDTIYSNTTTKSFTGLTQGVEAASSLTCPGQVCQLYSFQADQPCRLRIYATTAFAAADLSRPQTIDPVGNHGLLFEAVLAAAQTLTVSPEALMANQDSESAVFACNVRCDNGTTLNTTLKGMVLEP